jgi:DNA repair exonuclease SbcCD ATPase subunit/type IV secretory pathway TrbD component
VTAAEAARVFEESRPKAASGGSRFPAGIVLAIAGSLAAVAGVLLSQWIAVAAGIALVAVGVTMMLRKQPEQNPVSMDADLIRLKADAAAKSELARAAADEEERALSEWKTWMAQRGADAWGDDPVAVRELLEEVRTRAQKIAERDSLQAAADQHRAGANSWVARLVEAVSSFDSAGAQLPTLTGATELAARARATLEGAIRTDAEKRELSAQLVGARTALTSAQERLAKTESVIVEVSAARGLGTAEPDEQLLEMVRVHDQRSAEIQAEFELLANEVSALRTTLDRQGRDDQMAVARQQLEGARADARSVLADYAKHCLALRMLDEARERFEKERQGPVVASASRVFSAMTEGRYRSLLAPLDGSGISVHAANGERRTTDQLSRGTAEQLYLALRVGLIGSLGEMGRALPVLMDDVVVNFDPARRGGAVAAVAELASNRQVVFFTCHPETAELLADGVKGAAVVELSRCRLEA